MTVSDLIEMLETYPRNMEVRGETKWAEGVYPIHRLYTDKGEVYEGDDPNTTYLYLEIR